MGAVLDARDDAPAAVDADRVDARGVAVLVTATGATTISIEPEASVELTDSSSRSPATLTCRSSRRSRTGWGTRDGGGAGRPGDAGRARRRDRHVRRRRRLRRYRSRLRSFAYIDGRDTWETTRPNWVAFVTALAERLHADGRTLTVSIPPLYDADETADTGLLGLRPRCDRRGGRPDQDHGVRLLHGRARPDRPLAWVEQAVEGTKKAVADHSKLVLGVPTYGYNWVVATAGTCPPIAEGRTGVTARSVDDLIARRGATPVRDVASGEWTFTYELEVTDGATTCTQTREVHYVDADGARARIDLARDAGSAAWRCGRSATRPMARGSRSTTPSGRARQAPRRSPARRPTDPSQPRCESSHRCRVPIPRVRRLPKAVTDFRREP